MIDCISVENMRQSDAYTIENFVSSLELMYRAAYGVFKSVNWNGKIAIVSGSGNNGGDGFALACILNERGMDCVVYTVGRRLSADSQHYADIARQLGVEIVPFSANVDLAGYDYVVDCLLGTGFHGAVREDYRCAIEHINASGAFIVSVDINSGMNGDTGEGECIVRSDLTVSIGYVKNGLVTENAGRYMNRLVCVDIGIILTHQENKLYSQTEWHAFCDETGTSEEEVSVFCDGCLHLRCPAWLEL